MFRRTTNMWEIHTKLSKSLHAKEGLGTLRTQDVRGYTSILFGKKMTKTVPLNSLTCHQCQDDQHIWHGCFKRHEHIEKNNTFKGVLGTQYVIVVFIPFLYSSIKFLAIWHVFFVKRIIVMSRWKKSNIEPYWINSPCALNIWGCLKWKKKATLSLKYF